MRRALVALALILAGCAHRPAAPEREALEPGQILTAERVPLTEKELLRRAGEARYVLVGEAHDDACDHQVEAALVRLLGATGTWAVGFEMVSVDREAILDRFSSGDLPLDELGDALEWQTNWGIEFESYEPIFSAAQLTGTPVVALNLPTPVVRAMTNGEEDAVPDDLRSMITPDVIPVSEEQVEYLEQAYAAHTHGRTGEEGWRRFLFVQALWDSQMAWRAVQTNRELDRQVIVITGAAHVWNGWGIERRLRVFDPEARILSLVAWRGDGEPDPALSDLFFYCPAIESGAR